MNKLTMMIAAGLATLSFAAAAPAAAQLQLWEDYEPSEEVIEMTLVKVEEGQLDTYLEGLKQTWVKANEVQKELGYIKGYAIYGVPYGEGEFNLVLTIRFTNDDSLTPSKERYMEFMKAWGEANMDASQETVRELYNEIREIQGTYMLRELKMKM
ncbi:hypothetical protein [Erythrobacter sp.]|uniref:hypothetical protein n=1 Tax=Erythrobacter sp. TaxID=1042 RepID=UPI001425CAB4|nr:hypothetical protein [Erythrobacter sp.]QIQ86944.1 MAG: hypothetical protein G9473_09780 [Erythrobacter sp.]